MRIRLITAASFGWLGCALVLLAGAGFSAPAAEMKLQAFLLWGTNENKPPPDKQYNPAPPDIQERLRVLPLKWTNWFEVNRKEFAALLGTSRHVAMSAKCQVDMKQLGGEEVEVRLIGKGKEVLRRKQALPKGEALILGGDAPNSTSWLVVLKRIE